VTRWGLNPSDRTEHPTSYIKQALSELWHPSLVPRDLDHAIDPDRLAIYGHSAGGSTAAETTYEDARFAASVNMEGYLDWTPATPGELWALLPIAEYGMNRPMLMLGSSGFSDKQALDLSWTVMLAHPGHHTTRRQIAEANHWVFTDFAPMAAQLHADGLMTAADRDALTGTINPRVAVPEIRGLLRGFLDRAL
jgi:Prolyl oligopeptidase family